MTAKGDVFWSFRSPYSYIATPDLLRLREDFDVEVCFRPVLPIAVRSKGTLFTSDRKPTQYIIMDSFRRAEFLGMKIAFPSPDPVVQSLETFEVSEEQPHIFRLTGLCVEAERRGKGIEEPGWDQGDRLANAVAKAGLGLAEMEARIAEYDPMETVDDNHAALEAAGHWGVPTMVYEGEPFFGQDRIDTLRWRLKNAGLKRG